MVLKVFTQQNISRIALRNNLFRLFSRKPSRQTGNTAGFTLIELLIVISIIGILISVSVYGWTSVSARGRDTNRKSDLAQIKQSLKLYYSDYRAYPRMDVSPVIYSASWQLNVDGMPCQHSQSTGFGLATKYLAEVPQDPKDSTIYKGEGGAECSNLVEEQANKYLYLTSSSSTEPDKIPSRFGLMATLEKDTQLLDDKDNPFKLSNTSYLGPWYKSHVNVTINTNFLLDDRNQ